MRKVVLALLSLTVVFGAEAEELKGRVVDAVTGSAVAGARVTASPGSGTAVSGQDGAFVMQIQASGTIAVTVSHPAYQVRRVELASVPGALEIELVPRSSFADLIEVTASRAREGVDAATFTNIPKERIDQDYWAQDPAILLRDLAPGYYSYNDNGNGIGYSYFTIRGFGQARTRVAINGAPLNDAESGELFFIDLADFLSTAGDIQVQRGVFGLSGIGGAVDLTTTNPSAEPRFELESGAGSYGTQRFAAVYDSGIVDGRWALTARYSKISTDGYRDQSWVDMWNYFLSLARYGDRSRLRLVLFGGPEETHLAYEGVPRSVLDGALTGNADRDRRSNPLTFPGEIDHFYQPHFQLVHEAALPGGLELSQTFFYFQGDGYYEEYKHDRALIEYDLPDVVLPDGSTVATSDLVRRRTVDEWDAGWVPTLSLTRDSWTFTLAGEARLHDGHHWGDVRWAAYYPSGVDPDHRYYDYRVGKRTGELQLRVAWRATPALTLTAGVAESRHTFDLYEDRIKGASLKKTYAFTLPRAGAVLRLGDGAELYASVARGMREPAFRDIYDPEDYYGTVSDLAPEDVWDLEVGASVRRDWWRVRANAFLMRFANEIVYAGALDDSGVPIYGNGARSRHRGVEIDASADPWKRLGFDASLTLSRNTFTRYREYGYDGTVNVYDGNRIAGYPDVLANVTARTVVGPVRLALTALSVGRFYLDSSQDNRRHPELRQVQGYVPAINPAFTRLDFDVRLPLPSTAAGAIGVERLEARVRLNNVLDRRYTSFGYVDGEPVFIPAAGRNVFVGLKAGL